VAARAPDAGEDFGALAAKYPKPPASAGVIKKDGFFWPSEEAFPDLERFLAKRMNATTIELDSSHVSLVSHPKEIADLILLAAGRKKSPT
jgi:hypothetical protein